MQIYYRDTGEKIWDISTPIFVRGKQWGAFRIGVSLSKIGQAKRELIVALSIVIFGILLVSMVSVFLIVNFYIMPLKHLSKSACEVADGKIDVPLIVKSVDEVGQVTESIERLRISLKHAMKRLQKSA